MGVATAAAVAAAVIAIAASARSAAAEEGWQCNGQPATFVGTKGDDQVNRRTDLGSRNPVLVLRGGDDEVRIPFGDGYSAKLTVCAGSGNDRVPLSHTTPWRDFWISGGSGDDHLQNLSSSDFSDVGPLTMSGGAGRDHLRGGTYNDRLSGGSGNDELFGVGGNDRISGGSGDDRLEGEGGADKLFGDAGDDFLNGDAGDPGTSPARDSADGGSGTDECQAERKRECER